MNVARLLKRAGALLFAAMVYALVALGAAGLLVLYLDWLSHQ